MASRKPRKRTPNPPPVYVAVVYTPGGSMRSNGSLACFVGQNYLRVSAQALEAKQKWGSHYRVLVGTLTTEVVTPQEFSFIPVKDVT